MDLVVAPGAQAIEDRLARRVERLLHRPVPHRRDLRSAGLPLVEALRRVSWFARESRAPTLSCAMSGAVVDESASTNVFQVLDALTELSIHPFSEATRTHPSPPARSVSDILSRKRRTCIGLRVLLLVPERAEPAAAGVRPRVRVYPLSSSVVTPHGPRIRTRASSPCR